MTWGGISVGANRPRHERGTTVAPRRFQIKPAQSKTACPLSGAGGSVVLAFGLPGLAEVDADGGATVERFLDTVTRLDGRLGLAAPRIAVVEGDDLLGKISLEDTVRWYVDNYAWVEGIRTRGFHSDRLGLVKA